MDDPEATVAAYRADAICPECREGKHRNCDGSAWSVMIDARVSCSCDSTSNPEHPISHKGQEQAEEFFAAMEADLLSDSGDKSPLSQDPDIGQEPRGVGSDD